MLPVGSKTVCAQGLLVCAQSVKKVAEMTSVQAVSPVVSIGARIVHNAPDSTHSGAESANSPRSADNTQVSNNLHIKYFATICKSHTLQICRVQTVFCPEMLCCISSCLTAAAPSLTPTNSMPLFQCITFLLWPRLFSPKFQHLVQPERLAHPQLKRRHCLPNCPSTTTRVSLWRLAALI